MKCVKQHLNKKQIQDILTNAGQLTDNAINIVADMAKVFKSFNITFPEVKASSQRRLLDVSGHGEEEYPSWFPAADRELLLQAGKRRRVPNAVVAKDGSGRFRTIQDAINSCPPGFRGRFMIYVKAGVYVERVFIV